MQTFTLHTHTFEFDGNDTELGMVSRAAKLGFDTIGFSNHFIVHPEIDKAKFYRYARIGGYSSIYNARVEQVMKHFLAHYSRLDYVQTKFNIRILRGLEVDFFYHPEWLDMYRHALEILQPDYTIGACHIIECDGKLYNIHDIKHAQPDMQDVLLSLYWQKVRDAASSGLFTWMAHLDLPKKIGLGQGDKWIPEERKTIDVLASCNTALEINTGGFKRPCAEPYPSPRIMRMVKAHNIPVLISDDAHSVSQLGRYFKEAHSFAASYGVNNFINIQKILDFSNKNR